MCLRIWSRMGFQCCMSLRNSLLFLVMRYCFCSCSLFGRSLRVCSLCRDRYLDLQWHWELKCKALTTQWANRTLQVWPTHWPQGPSNWLRVTTSRADSTLQRKGPSETRLMTLFNRSSVRSLRIFQRNTQSKGQEPMRSRLDTEGSRFSKKIILLPMDRAMLMTKCCLSSLKTPNLSKVLIKPLNIKRIQLNTITSFNVNFFMKWIQTDHLNQSKFKIFLQEIKRLIFKKSQK